jgi:hypothetical protein
LELSVVVLRIVRWNPDCAWVDWPEYYRTHLQWRLARLTDLDKASIKRLARRICDRECAEISISEAADELDSNSLRSFLEAVGAEIVTELSQDCE